MLFPPEYSVTSFFMRNLPSIGDRAYARAPAVVARYSLFGKSSMPHSQRKVWCKLDRGSHHVTPPGLDKTGRDRRVPIAAVCLPRLIS